MLTLTRRPNESIVIETSDGLITVTVTGIKGNQVELKFDAPDNVDIWREELLDDDAA